MTYILIAIVAAAVVGWLALRSRRGAPTQTTPSDEDTAAVIDAENRQFHAVSIKAGIHRCSSVKDLEGVRIMSTEAPRLPLPDCDVEECTCRYEHHDDRRVEGDRRIPFSTGGAWQLIGDPDKEQRSGRERRQDDAD